MVKYKIQTVVLVLIAFALGCNEFIIVGILSDISKQLAVSTSQIGYLVTLFALVYAISTPIITIFVSSFNRFKTFIALLIFFIISNTLSGLANSYTFLAFSRIITALVAGVIISIAMTFASVIAGPEKRGMIISWIFSGFSIASVFGVPMGTMISSMLGWRFAFYAISLVSIVTLIPATYLLPRNIKQVKSSLKLQVSLIRDPRIYISMLLPMFSLAAVYTVYTYIQPLLSINLHFSIAGITWMLSAYGIATIISNQLSGKLVTHGGLKKMPVIYLIQTFILLALSISLKSQLTGVINIIFIGITMYLISSPVQIHFLNISEQDYPQSMVLASSLNSIFANFGISLGSASGSIMAFKVGLNNLGMIGAVYAVISMLLTIRLNKIVENYQISKTKE